MNDLWINLRSIMSAIRGGEGVTAETTGAYCRVTAARSDGAVYDISITEGRRPDWSFDCLLQTVQNPSERYGRWIPFSFSTSQPFSEIATSIAFSSSLFE
jgi:hypothetical protein